MARVRGTRGVPGESPSTRAVGVVASATLVALTALEFSGAYDVLAPYSVVSPFILVMAVAAVVAGARLLIRPVRPPMSSLVTVALFVIAIAISYVSSGLEPSITTPGAQDAVNELLFTAVVLVLAIGTRSWAPLAVAISTPMAVIGALSALNEYVLPSPSTFGGFVRVSTALGEGTVAGRYSGPLEDPNFWGRFLVVGLAFGLALLTHAVAQARTARASGVSPVRGWWRLAYCVATLGAILVAIYLTGSRGAFLATGVTVIAYVLAVGVRLRVVLLWALPTPLLFLIPGVGSRMASILGLAEAAQRAGVDGSVLERLATQQVALAMIADNPVTGVGPGGYFTAFPTYAAIAQANVERVVAPHNLYLGLWAEVGALGLLAWLAIMVVALSHGLRSVALIHLLPRRTTVSSLRPYVAATLAALLGWSTAGIFLHGTYLRIALILVAFAAAQRQTVQGLVGAIGLNARVPAIPPRLLRRVAAAVLVTGIGGLAGSGAVSALPGTATAQVRAFLAPAEDNIYLINLRSRASLVPTYAVVVETAITPESGTVDAQGDGQQGLVTLTTTAGDQDTARALATEAMARGDQALSHTGLTRLYHVQWQSISSWVQPRTTTTRLLGAAAGGVAALVLTALVVGAYVLVTRRHGLLERNL